MVIYFLRNEVYVYIWISFNGKIIFLFFLYVVKIRKLVRGIINRKLLLFMNLKD